MSKREKIQWIRRVWQYLADSVADAYERKDEINFDWYSDGKEALFCALQERPIHITRRVRPL